MERFIKRKNRASNAQYREGWDRIFAKKRCECEACVEDRKRKKAGLPLIKDTGGPICPTPTSEKRNDE